MARSARSIPSPSAPRLFNAADDLPDSIDRLLADFTLESGSHLAVPR